MASCEVPPPRRTVTAPLALALAALALLTLSACGDRSPDADAWPTAAPHEVGLDPRPLARLASDLRDGPLENLHAVVLIKDGRLVWEDHLPGHRPDALQYTASISKSVAALVFGSAMDRGLLPGLDEGALTMTLAELLPEYSAVLAGDPRKAGVTLHHVLSMTAGLQWDEKSHPYSDPRNDWRQASQRDDPVQFVLERPVVHPPGTHFEYNGGLSILLAYLLERETGRHVDELAAELLFRPLGIADVRWDRLPGGITDTDGGLHLRPRDLARIGQLVLAGGTWQGRRVVSREWLERATRSQVSNPDGPDYGYQWWCGDFHHHGKADAAFLASGHGGQALFGLPGRGAVVVIAQDVFDNPVGPLNGLAILGRYVLPALDPACRPAPVVPVPAAALERYTGAYGAEVVAVTVFRRGEALWAEGSDGTSMMLEPLGHDRFRGTLFGLLDLRFVFAPDPDGTIGRVTSSFGFRETTLTRLP